MVHVQLGITSLGPLDFLSGAWHISLIHSANTCSMNFQETGDKHPEQSHFSTLDTQLPAARLKICCFIVNYILQFMEHLTVEAIAVGTYIHISSNPPGKPRMRLSLF